jgi:hypothetical protein
MALSSLGTKGFACSLPKFLPIVRKTPLSLSPSNRSGNEKPFGLISPLVSHPCIASSPAMSYFFSAPVDIDIVLEDADERPTVDMKLDKDRKEKAPLYADGESVKGQVTIRPKDGKKLEHTGIKVQFIGTIGETFRSTPPPPRPLSTTAPPLTDCEKCSSIAARTTNSSP